jgi:hypothetical protein
MLSSSPEKLPGHIWKQDTLDSAVSRTETGTMARKPKKEIFSATKAVKANARERLGSPPPSRPLPTPKEKAAAKPKHKQTLADLLQSPRD